MKGLLFAIHFMAAVGICCGQGYNFNQPDTTFILPDSLLEISGLTDIDEKTLGCVQDEKGIIFVVDASNGQIQERKTFYLNGDYEGLTLVDKKDMYVLRSDATLFCVSDFFTNAHFTDSIKLDIPHLDNEGLGFDEENYRLLIASKSKRISATDEKNTRYVYGFDLKEKKLLQQPLMKFTLNEITTWLNANGINDSILRVNGVRKIKFMPASIGVHPITRHSFVLSAVDRLLIEFNTEGIIKKIHVLNQDWLPKPEGLTFMPNGDLYISSEGKGQKATLLKFSYK